MPINSNSLSGTSADKITLAYVPSNSTPTVEEHTDATNQLSAILNGVDTAIGDKSASDHTHSDYATAGKAIALAMVFS